MKTYIKNEEVIDETTEHADRIDEEGYIEVKSGNLYQKITRHGIFMKSDETR